MIYRLPRDEFGDFIYKGTDIEDYSSQKLRAFCVIFQTLIHKLRLER